MAMGCGRTGDGLPLPLPSRRPCRPFPCLSHQFSPPPPPSPIQDLDTLDTTLSPEEMAALQVNTRAVWGVAEFGVAGRRSGPAALDSERESRRERALAGRLACGRPRPRLPPMGRTPTAMDLTVLHQTYSGSERWIAYRGHWPAARQRGPRANTRGRAGRSASARRPCPPSFSPPRLSHSHTPLSVSLSISLSISRPWATPTLPLPSSPGPARPSSGGRQTRAWSRRPGGGSGRLHPCLPCASLRRPPPLPAGSDPPRCPLMVRPPTTLPPHPAAPWPAGPRGLPPRAAGRGRRGCASQRAVRLAAPRPRRPLVRARPCCRPRPSGRAAVAVRGRPPNRRPGRQRPPARAPRRAPTHRPAPPTPRLPPRCPWMPPSSPTCGPLRRLPWPRPPGRPSRTHFTASPATRTRQRAGLWRASSTRRPSPPPPAPRTRSWRPCCLGGRVMGYRRWRRTRTTSR